MPRETSSYKETSIEGNAIHASNACLQGLPLVIIIMMTFQTQQKILQVRQRERDRSYVTQLDGDRAAQHQHISFYLVPFNFFTHL